VLASCSGIGDGEVRTYEREGIYQAGKAALMFTKPRLEWEASRMYQATCEVQIRLTYRRYVSFPLCHSMYQLGRSYNK
jgi:hypothetical protein